MSESFEQLVIENQGRIRQIARRYAGSQDLEDLYQEILLELWRSFRGFRGDSRAETWVYRVALNTAMAHLGRLVKRRETRRRMESQPAAVAVVGERSQAAILAEFLSSLGEIDASLLMMYMDGLSAQEMSSVLGMTTNNVNVRISRIKKRFTEEQIR